MAANGQVKRRDTNKFDQDRGRLMTRLRTTTQIMLQCMANTLGIKHSTACSIVANYLRTGRRGKLAKRGYIKNGKYDRKR